MLARSALYLDNLAPFIKEELLRGVMIDSQTGELSEVAAEG